MSWGQQQQQGWGNQYNSNLFNPNQNYQIVTALDDDRVLDISQANNATKFQTILWSKNGDPNQVFRFRQVANGKYAITCGTGATLQVPNNSSANGTQLLGGQAHNNISEAFEVYPSQNVQGGYIIKAFNNKVLDCFEGKSSKGNSVIQWDYNGGKNQTWFIKPF